MTVTNERAGELPEPEAWAVREGIGDSLWHFCKCREDAESSVGYKDTVEGLYTADQMRAYATAALTARDAQVGELVEWAAGVGELIRTQDNRITSNPIFVVEQKRGNAWTFVTACLTEQGCKDYLAVDGHNLTNPRIYGPGGFRNQEWQNLRDFLTRQEKV